MCKWQKTVSPMLCDSKCSNNKFHFHTLQSVIVSSRVPFNIGSSLVVHLYSIYFSTHIVMNDEWFSCILFFPVIWFVRKNKRVKVPRLKVQFTGNKDMCDNFQIVFTDTILFYWLETVLSKGNHTKEIRENEKLKQSIDGSFLTAKNEKAVLSQGKRGWTWCLKQWALWRSQLQRIP